jgi:predicted DNA-binding transcriptional regulator AlpA
MLLDQEPRYSQALAVVADQLGVALAGRYSLSRVASIIECSEADVRRLIETGELRTANTPTSAIEVFGIEVIYYLFGDMPVNKISNPRSDESDKMLRINQVAQLLGLSRSTIDRMEARDQFPARVKLSTRRVAWRQSEILAWMSQRK